MKWDSLASFFAMGGYAPFVWPAFAVAAAVLLGLLIASLRRLRAARSELAAVEASGSRRRDRV
jgi:heme exporter protein D